MSVNAGIPRKVVGSNITPQVLSKLQTRSKMLVKNIGEEVAYLTTDPQETNIDNCYPLNPGEKECFDGGNTFYLLQDSYLSARVVVWEF